jgi:hypothetical protein
MRKRRVAVAAIVLGVVAFAAVGLTLSASADQRTLAFSNGVNAFGLGGWVFGANQMCERDVHVEQAFDSIQFLIRGVPPEPSLGLTVTRAGSRRVLARGVAPRGWARGLTRPSVSTTPLSRGVPAGGSVNICFRRAGGGKQAGILAGNKDLGADASHAVFVESHGRALKTGRDIHLVFLRQRGESVLSQIPAMFRRAALFRPSFVGAWTYWALLAVVLLAVPALLVRALWAAERESPDTPG